MHEMVRKIIRSKGFWIVLNIASVFVYIYWVYILLPPGSRRKEILLKGLGFIGGLFVIFVLGYILYSLRHNVSRPGLQEWWYDIIELSVLLTRVLPFVLLGLPLYIMGRQVLADQGWSGELMLVILSALFAYFGGDFYRQERRRLEEWTREAISIWNRQGISGLLMYLERIYPKDVRVFERVLQYLPEHIAQHLRVVGSVILTEHTRQPQGKCDGLLQSTFVLWDDIIAPTHRNRLLRALLDGHCYEGSDRVEWAFRELIYRFVYKDVPVFETFFRFLDPESRQEKVEEGSLLFPLSPHAETSHALYRQIESPIIASRCLEYMELKSSPFLFCIGEKGVGRTTLALHFASFSYSRFGFAPKVSLKGNSIIIFPAQFPVYVALQPGGNLLLPLIRQVVRVTLAVMWFFFPVWKQEWFALPEWAYVTLLFRFFEGDVEELFESLRHLPFYNSKSLQTFMNLVRHAPLLSTQRLFYIWPVARRSTERFLTQLPNLWLSGRMINSRSNISSIRFHFFIDFQWVPREEELRAFFIDLHRLHFDPAVLFLPYTEPLEETWQWVKLQWDKDMLRKLLKQLKIDLYAWVDVETEAKLEDLLIEAAQNNPQRMIHLLARTQMEAYLRGGEIPEEVFYNIIHEDDDL